MKKTGKVLVPLLLALALIACTIWYLFVYDRELTRDLLIYQARQCEKSGNHELASWFYLQAYSHADNDQDVAIELAQQYQSSGNFTKAEYTLSQAIADRASAPLYQALCRVYIAQDKLLDAVSLLDNIPDPAIKAELDGMRPAAPATNYAPGFYTQYLQIDIDAQDGTLYVTTNGEYPSVMDVPYTEPITLGAGETTVYAICVSDSGLVSPLTVCGYTIGGVVEPVTLADAAMDNAIRAALGVDADTVLYTDQLWTITEFTVPSQAENYQDLALLTYVRSLTFEGGVPGQLASLAGLAQLKELNIYSLRVNTEELAVIGSLPALEKLTLSGCSLSTAEPLSGLTQLRYLDLSYNTIGNLTPLVGMTQLTELYLQHCAVSGLDALAGLSELQTLNLSYNAVADVTPLASLKSLFRLNLSNNRLTSLDPLGNLTALSELDASHNSLTQVTALVGCIGLKELDLSSNQLTDVLELGTLTGLQTLRLATNQITQLPAWSKDAQLITIDASYNLITDLTPLAGLPLLNNVYMDYNQELASIECLASCKLLSRVDVYGTQVTQVHALTDIGVVVNYNPMG